MNQFLYRFIAPDLSFRMPLHLPHLNVHIGWLVVIILMTAWWTYSHYVNKTRHVKTIIHDAREGFIRGMVSGAVSTGNPVQAAVSGVVFGVVSGFVRALHAPKPPQSVVIEDLLDARID